MDWPPQLHLKDDELLTCAWGLWGSTGRGEMTIFSDWDVFCWSPLNSTISTQRNIIEGRWHSAGATGYIDLLICESVDINRDFALTNATDLHAIYFLSNLRGNKELIFRCMQAQQDLRKQENIRVREIFHLLTTHHAFQNLYCPSCPRASKFCSGGTRSWSTLAQIAYFYQPSSAVYDTSSGLRNIGRMTGDDPHHLEEAFVSSWRIRQSEEAGVKISLFDSALNRLEAIWHEAVGRVITCLLPWSQYYAGVSPDLLSKMLGIIVPRYSFTIPIPRHVDPSIEGMLRIFCENRYKQLEAINCTICDWWSIHALVMNSYTSAKCLHQLAFPKWEVNNQAWRNIRLYVVKHPNVAYDTLSQLASTPGLRSIEYAEIKKRLNDAPNP